MTASSLTANGSADLAISLATFGMVATAVVAAMKKERSKQLTLSDPIENSPLSGKSLYPYHPPSSLVNYLKDRGGRKWEHYSESIEEFVRECPKVELHVHLDGSLDPDFLWHYMQKYDDNGEGWINCLPVSTTLPWDPRHPLPVRHLVKNCNTVDDFHDLCTCRRGERSLQHMLTCFEIFLPLVRGAPPPALVLLEELAYDFCRRQWEQHVVYTEVRYNPHLLMKEDKGVSGSYDSFDSNDADASIDATESNSKRRQSARGVIQAITKGLRRGCSDFGVIVNQILCAINWRPDWAWDVLNLAEEFRHNYPCNVVGVDIAAGEEHFDSTAYAHLHQSHFDMMQKAQELGIPIAIHAGETPNGLDHVRQAIASNKHPVQPGYGAQRIGHGYRMIEDKELMQQFAKERIHVEICPTSSVETGGWIFEHEGMEKDNARKRKPWKEHPGLIMMQHGVPISLNSDDPAVFHTSLTWQYRIALIKMGLTPDQVVQSNIHAIEASFGAPDEKAKVERELRNFLGSMAAGGEKPSNQIRSSQCFTDRVRDPF